MSVKRTVIQALVTSFAIACFNLLIQPVYEGYLVSLGHTMGVAELGIAYFAVFVISYVVAFFMSRNRGAEVA